MANTKPRRGALSLLTVREVLHAGLGDHADGGGLILNVRPNSATWVFRYTSPTGKRREMGLGSRTCSDAASAGKSLMAARAAAGDARALVARGIDPIDARVQAVAACREQAAATKTAAKVAHTTLARAARDYHERVIEPRRSEKHAAQWIASLENHMPPTVWHAPIAAVEAGQLLDFLIALDERVPETASRIRQRLEAVFDDAVLRKLVPTNPAAVIRRAMTELSRKNRVKAYRYLSHIELPGFWTRLMDQNGPAASAMALLILTASRTGDVLHATWDEFGLDAGIWRIAAGRMKAKEEHIVHLSAAAIAIVERQARDPNRDRMWVFPSPMLLEKPMSNMAMLNVLNRLGAREKTVVHGFRSTFSTWANESGSYRPDVIEACLAHSEADRVRKAYNRAQFTDERAALMRDWGAFVTGIVALPMLRTQSA